ncbi:hypothetical protein MBLNU459_g6368t1 [Dothideomycetes sp. NU459]
MAADDVLPFLDHMKSPSSPTSIQYGNNVDRDSVDGLVDFDVEKTHGREGDGYVALDREKRSIFGMPLESMHGHLLAFWTYILAFLSLLVIAALCTTAVFGILRSRTIEILPGRLPGYEYTSSGELLSCGSSFEEAEAAGCIFDIMTFAWTPPACLDTEVHSDVVSDLSELAPTRGAGTWPWWRWDNLTEPLEQSSEVLSQYDDIWTDTYYHRAHCLYLWRIMHKASTRLMEGKKEVYVKVELQSI